MQRDDMDKNRKESPLIQVEDAVLVDSSEMTFDETVEHIYTSSTGANLNE